MFRILNNHCRSGVQQKVLFFLVLGHLVSRADRLTFLLCRSSLFRLWVSLTIVNLRLTSLLSSRPAIGNSRLRCQLHLPLCVYMASVSCLSIVFFWPMSFVSKPDVQCGLVPSRWTMSLSSLPSCSSVFSMSQTVRLGSTESLTLLPSALGLRDLKGMTYCYFHTFC